MKRLVGGFRIFKRPFSGLEAPFTAVSSSSPSISVGGGYTNYDVFLSFMGEDTRHNFTDHLYHALRDAFINTFRDDQEIPTGETLKPELEAAIRLSKASIIVISKNYAYSSWCLDELALILEEKKKHSDRIVIPIFYHVDPSDVRKLHHDTFGKAMRKHRKKAKTDPLEKRRIMRWEAALKEVANLKGSMVVDDGSEVKFIQEIVREISEKLRRNVSIINLPLLIGRNDLVGDIISSWLWKRSSNAVDILTIFGIAGIGKTTLAKYIYHLSIGQPFDGRSFLEDIGPSPTPPKIMLELQKKLLRDIEMGSQEISNVATGTDMIQEALRDKKLLLVLDDLNDVEQLKSLLGNGGFHPGTKVIITTNEMSLPQGRIDVYIRDNIQSNCNYAQRLLEGLSEDASLELLCKHAFGYNHIEEGFEELSRKVAEYCGGHPLALEVLGKSLYQYGRVVWEETVEALSKEVSPKIQKALQISFELLEYPSDKESFKHIACFFVGEERNYVETILDACGVHPLSTIPSLTNKRLLTIDPLSNKLKMHQLVQEMVRDMVHQESPGEPWERSRLWCHDESFNVLRLGKGSTKIKGLVLDMTMLNQENQQNSREFDLKTDSFKRMERLELLKLNFVILKEPYGKFPKSLKWLCWHGFPLESIPTDLKMENLVVLDMSYSKLKRWETHNRLGALKIKKLLLRSCDLLESLSSLPSTITLLDVGGCRSLKKVTFQSDVNESVLRQVELSHCVQLTEVQGFFKGCSVKEDEKVLTSLGWFDDGFVRNFQTRNPFCKNVPAEVVYEFGIFSTWFLGENIPDWLIVDEKNKGPLVSFTVPSSRMDYRIQGLNVCSAHRVPYKLLHKSSKRVKINNTTKNLTWIYEPQGWDVEMPLAGKSKDMVLLSHWRFRNQLEEGDDIIVTIGKDGDEAYSEDITMSNDYNAEVIKEVGICLVYSKDGDDKKDEQIDDPFEYYNDKCWKHVIGGDLSPFQLPTGEYHLISQRPRNVMRSELDHLRIRLEHILTATDNFNDQNLIGNDGYGKVYTGKIFRSCFGTDTGNGDKYAVAIKRWLSDTSGQRLQEFVTEVATLSNYKHRNLISLVGFCDEDDEKILVYDFAERASLDKYLVANKSSNELLTWKQRLKICMGAARGLDHLHYCLRPKHRIINRDIKSSNILLDENWEAKVSDFWLSRVGPVNQMVTFYVTGVASTLGYCYPLYYETGILTKESDIYSFGVILLEVLCGRLAPQPEVEDEQKLPAQWARSHLQQKRIHEFIDPSIKGSINHESLDIFSTIAYQCLQDDREQPPTMDLIVKELERALYHQETWMDMMESGEHLIIDPRHLSIAWGNDRRYWKWNRIKDYDGQTIEVAKLREVCWLHMKGTYSLPDSYLGIQCEIAFEVKLEEDCFGWEKPITLKLSYPRGGEIQVQERQIFISDMPQEEWIKLHVGNFNVEKVESRQVTFELFEKGDHWKSGLIVKRVIIRKATHKASS